MTKVVYLTEDIIIKKHTYLGIPFAEYVSKNLEDEKTPVVFYYHGFTGDKEWHSQDGYELAKRGIRTIIPDAHLHGERMEQPLTNDDVIYAFDIISKSLQEFDQLVQYLDERKLIDTTRIGVTGASMGGMTIAALFATHPEIKAAAMLMGTAALTEFYQSRIQSFQETNQQINQEVINQMLNQVQAIDLSRQPELIHHRPFLIWHDKDDIVVPFAQTKNFVDEIKNTSYAEKVIFRTTKGQGHNVTYRTTQLIADFFAKNL